LAPLYTLQAQQLELVMGISAVRGSNYTPQAQRVDTQRALELHQQARPKAMQSPTSTQPVAILDQRRDAAPQKDKGSRVDVWA
jgi:hypothetical protein